MKLPACPAKRGFTIIEMVIALSVFLLLAGAVFGIFSATLQGVLRLQDNQNRGDQTEALAAWFKQQMLDLPARGGIVSYHRDEMPFHVAGIIWGEGEDLQALGLQKQANGEYSLRMTSFLSAGSISNFSSTDLPGTASLSQFKSQILRDDEALVWRTLVPDLKSADWRFRSFNQLQWQDASLGQKPVLVEFTFQPAGASIITDDFWIPPTQPVRNLAVAPVTAVSINP